MVPSVFNVNWQVMQHWWIVNWQKIFYAYRILKQENLHHYSFSCPSLFLTGISDFITCWYWNLDRAKVYDKSNVWNPVCKLVHRTFEEIHLVRSVASYSYLGSDPGIQFDTYSWASLFSHATMEQFLRCTFDYHPSMFVSIIKLKVCDFLSNPTSDLKVGLEKLKRLRNQVKFLSENLTKFESNQNYT